MYLYIARAEVQDFLCALAAREGQCPRAGSPMTPFVSEDIASQTSTKMSTTIAPIAKPIHQAAPLPIAAPTKIEATRAGMPNQIIQRFCSAACIAYVDLTAATSCTHTASL